MNFFFQPWQLLVLILAAWINREQHKVIDYLRLENQILREKLGKRHILLNDDQRRRLAVKGKVLGRKLLAQFGTLVTPDTILRWHHLLVAKKWDYSQRQQQNPGRPPTKPRPHYGNRCVDSSSRIFQLESLESFSPGHKFDQWLPAT